MPTGRDVVRQLVSQAARLAGRVFRRLPPGMRERLKGALGALGHEPGWAQRLRARDLAQGRKRLDILMEAMAERLQAANFGSFRGAACLEYGSGHLLSEALIYHLAGASRVVAADHFRLLQDDEVRRALDGVDAEILIRERARWDDTAAVRGRFDALKRRTDWSLPALNDIGVSYVAPYDAAAGPLPGETFDLISSLSVLEHVPPAAAPVILGNLLAMLRPTGTMVHNIHLEDHRDIEGDPFAFLAAGTDWSDADHDSRGNRLRASDWVRIVESIPGAVVARVAPMIKSGTRLPDALDPAFAAYDPIDLRTSRIIIVVKRERLSST
jgi:hypothetical protein